MAKITNPHQLNQGSKIKIEETTKEVKHTHPIFCFKYLDKPYGLDKCTAQEKKNLIEQIVLLSKNEWKDIDLAQRHGLGYEKIKNTSSDRIKARVKTLKNSLLTEDVQYLLAFRFDGKKAMVGHKSSYIFHVLFIDRDFTLYNH